MSSSSINAPNLDTSSAPMDHAYGSGGGSIIASMMARGIAVSRYTLHGTIRPWTGHGNGRRHHDPDSFGTNDVRISPCA